MKREEYAVMYQAEDVHWWYVGLHNLVLTQLGLETCPRSSLRVLDAGCGTGGMLAALNGSVSSVGVDRSSIALSFCHRQRGMANLEQASVLALPFPAEQFDVVISLDVISDKDAIDDLSALREFYRVLRPGGRLCLNLPALNLLRGEHDIAVETVRRYTTGELAGKLAAVGFQVEKLTYWDSLLFPAILAYRLLSRKRAGETTAHSDVKVPPWPVNATLARVVKLEARLLRRLNFPLGASVFCIARRPE